MSIVYPYKEVKLSNKQSNISDRLGARLEKYPSDLWPYVTDPIPQELLATAEARLQQQYPKLYQRYHQKVARRYFADFLSGAAGLLREDDASLTFILEDRYANLPKGVSKEARDLFIYLHLIHELIEESLAEPEETLTPELNREMVAFIAQALAYYNLTEEQKQLLHQAAEILDKQEPDIKDRYTPVFDFLDQFDSSSILTEENLTNILAFISLYPEFEVQAYDADKVTSFITIFQELFSPQPVEREEAIAFLERHNWKMESQVSSRGFVYSVKIYDLGSDRYKFEYKTIAPISYYSSSGLFHYLEDSGEISAETPEELLAEFARGTPTGGRLVPVEKELIVQQITELHLRVRAMQEQQYESQHFQLPTWNHTKYIWKRESLTPEQKEAALKEITKSYKDGNLLVELVELLVELGKYEEAISSVEKMESKGELFGFWRGVAEKALNTIPAEIREEIKSRKPITPFEKLRQQMIQWAIPTLLLLTLYLFFEDSSTLSGVLPAYLPVWVGGIKLVKASEKVLVKSSQVESEMKMPKEETGKAFNSWQSEMLIEILLDGQARPVKFVLPVSGNGKPVDLNTLDGRLSFVKDVAQRITDKESRKALKKAIKQDKLLNNLPKEQTNRLVYNFVFGRPVKKSNPQVIREEAKGNNPLTLLVVKDTDGIAELISTIQEQRHKNKQGRNIGKIVVAPSTEELADSLKILETHYDNVFVLEATGMAFEGKEHTKLVLKTLETLLSGSALIKGFSSLKVIMSQEFVVDSDGLKNDSIFRQAVFVFVNKLLNEAAPVTLEDIKNINQVAKFIAKQA